MKLAEGIKLIVGLGNIGNEYAETRHNVGFWYIDQIAQRHNTLFTEQKKFLGKTAKIRLNSDELILLKPSTLMNRSGLSVVALSHFYKLQPKQILVVHDDLDLMPGVKKFRLGGGTGGHNGLKSITQQLGSSDYYRLRFGIGHPRSLNLQIQVADFVLSSPNKEDRSKIDDCIDSSLTVIDDLSKGNFDLVFQQVNTK
ncbi:MAG: aminoacyl-tRNA hydrolase [Burkholderiaceae bacterium]|nr:aminoacyl-tRNA hydrolase [Burkholderiaceae bacterium]